MIRANCRSSFQMADFDFLISSLHRKPSSGEQLQPALLAGAFLKEAEGLDDLLDRQEVYKAILEAQGCLTVSPQFYFYVLVRHVLMEAGLTDRDLADYVASLLAEFSVAQRLAQVEAGDERRFNYVFELLEELQTATGPRVFLIRAHVGNVSLFFTGLFPEHIAYRAQRRGAPNLDYFENLGGANYLSASGHRMARELRLNNILECLGDRFQQVRQALNQLADRLVSIEDYFVIQEP